MALAENLFNDLVDDLQTTHGSNLVSVVLYGSAVAGDFVRAVSDFNLLIVLEKIRPRDLRAAQAPMREWRRMGNPLPVYFTRSELQTASDVFPIEFHQMRKARKVLYGEDLLANLNISTEFLRHQTEYELRSKLIQLRRHYIPASVSVERLANLMSESLVSFSSLFRAVLLLHNVEPPLAKHDVIHSLQKLLRIDCSAFEKIFEMREKNAFGALDEVAANRLFSEYMVEIEAVIESVDRLEKS
jgi:predicted nucleotidyltransferase